MLCYLPCRPNWAQPKGVRIWGSTCVEKTSSGVTERTYPALRGRSKKCAAWWRSTNLTRCLLRRMQMWMVMAIHCCWTFKLCGKRSWFIYHFKHWWQKVRGDTVIITRCSCRSIGNDYISVFCLSGRPEGAEKVAARDGAFWASHRGPGAPQRWRSGHHWPVDMCTCQVDIYTVIVCDIL